MASYILTVKMPNLAKGELVAISGLGEFKNGARTTISEEQHNQWRATHVKWDAEKEKWMPGPTLLQANLPAGVTAETSKDEPEKVPEEETPSTEDKAPQGEEKKEGDK